MLIGNSRNYAGDIHDAERQGHNFEGLMLRAGASKKVVATFFRALPTKLLDYYAIIRKELLKL